MTGVARGNLDPAVRQRATVLEAAVRDDIRLGVAVRPGRCSAQPEAALTCLGFGCRHLVGDRHPGLWQRP